MRAALASSIASWPGSCSPPGWALDAVYRLVHPGIQNPQNLCDPEASASHSKIAFATASITSRSISGGACVQVFMVNPVQSSGDETLTDQKDSATAVPVSDYATVQLRNLDGSGTLTGGCATST